MGVRFFLCATCFDLGKSAHDHTHKMVLKMGNEHHTEEETDIELKDLQIFRRLGFSEEFASSQKMLGHPDALVGSCLDSSDVLLELERE